MKGLVRWIAKLFRGASRRTRGGGYDPTSFQFPPIDLDIAAKDLKLKEKAINNGLSELPASDSSQLDGPQYEVIQFVKSEVADIATAFETKISGIRQQITRRDVRSSVHEVSNLDQDFDHELLSLRDEFRPRLDSDRAELETAEREFRAFRASNSLDREPEYPDRHLLHGMIVVAVLVAESLMNAIFFEKGNPHGLVGGAVYALLLASIDVVAVFSLGYWGARIFSTSHLHRFQGAGALTIFVAWAILYNLIVSHIREALQVDPERAMELARASFGQSPIGLAQADSWILFFAGMFFSIFAMLDGFNWTDPFPGYAKRHRKLKLLASELQHVKDQYIRSARDNRENAFKRLADCLVTCRNSLISMDNDIDTKRLLLVNASTFVRHQEDNCNALIAIYRDENQKARSSPPPKYFNRKWELPLPETFTDDTTRDVELLGECQAALSALEARAAEIRQAIGQRYDQFRSEQTDGSRN